MSVTRSRLQRRDYAELIIRRAEHLPQDDRALLNSVFADGRAIRDLAALIGSDPRGLRRRACRLTRRLLSDRFVFVVSHRESWPALRRRLATACFLHGQSMKQAAAGANTSFYNARKQLDAVHALLDSIVNAKKVTTENAERHGEGSR